MNPEEGVVLPHGDLMAGDDRHNSIELSSTDSIYVRWC